MTPDPYAIAERIAIQSVELEEEEADRAQKCGGNPATPNAKGEASADL